MTTTVPPIVLPAPTFRHENGKLDVDLNAQYSQLIADTWVPRVIVAGPMGHGEACTVAERVDLMDLWSKYVIADRLIAACWTQQDAEAAQERGLQCLVMVQADEEDELRQQVAASPEGSWIYANPRYSQIVLTPEKVTSLTAESAISGIKMSKVSIADIERMQAAHPGLVIAHGSSRSIQGSLSAGADLVTATPLAATPANTPSPDLDVVQNHVSSVQQWIDTQDNHTDRVAGITAAARHELR